MDKRITRFIKRHHVLTLATQGGGDGGGITNGGGGCDGMAVWTAHLFYAYLPDEQAVVFTTDPATRHGREMLANPAVAAGIVLETKVIGKIRGIQLTGRADPVDEGADKKYRNAYLRRFPFAVAAKLDLWVLKVDYVKMTDNRMGFGRKIEWRRT